MHIHYIVLIRIKLHISLYITLHAEYIEELKSECIKLCKSGVQSQSRNITPPPSLCSEYEKPEKSIAVQRHYRVY